MDTKVHVWSPDVLSTDSAALADAHPEAMSPRDVSPQMENLMPLEIWTFQRIMHGKVVQIRSVATDPGMTLTDGGIDEPVVYPDIPTRTSFSIPEGPQRPALRKEYYIAASVGDDQAYHHRGQEPSQPTLGTDAENVKAN
ncbi:MAG: hypothetical protein Q9191_002957 [Dirinaria sp. TL-2023a]